MPARSSEPLPVRLRRRAMDFLARREHTFSELTQKLTEREPEADADLIFATLDKLKQENLQSDARFLESYIHHRMLAGMGPVKIRYELQNKGINHTDAGEALCFYDREVWQELALTQLQKKYRQLEVTAKNRQKVWAFLQQRGFDSETARKAAEQFLSRNY